MPTDQLEAATSLIETKDYTRAEPPEMYNSMLPLFPRFKCKGTYLFFYLVSSQYCHFDCKPANLERSGNDLPYPKLEIFTQSLLDTCDRLALTDLVDGMNLSEEWGKNALSLSGLTDAAWMQWNCDKIIAYEKLRCPDEMIDDNYVATGFNKREIWEKITRGKQHRCGFKYPTELYATRFRAHNSPDPRTLDRWIA